MVVKSSFSLSLSSPRPRCPGPHPRSIGRLHDFTEPATGADLSSDQTLLAVCSSTVTRVYRRDDVNSPGWQLMAAIRYTALPIEGIAWDGRDLALVAEGGGFYRLAEKIWRAARPWGEPAAVATGWGSSR